MPLTVTTTISSDVFTCAKDSEQSFASRKLRIIIKEKGGSWQDTVLRSESGFPQGTEWIMNCFPGSKVSHHLVRRVSSVRNLEDLESGESELRQLYGSLQEQRNTSPVTVPAHRYKEWYRFVNEKVWNKFHKSSHVSSDLGSLDSDLVITSEEWRLYQTVNKKYAKALARDIISDLLARRPISLDINWLHDYQIMLVFHYLEQYLKSVISELTPSPSTGELSPHYSEEEQRRLQKALPTALRAIKTSYFHHIPWPDVDTFKAEFPSIPNFIRPSLPEDDDSDTESEIAPEPDDLLNTGKEIIDGLLSSNHIAFQTEKDASNFIDCVRFYYPDARFEAFSSRHTAITLPTKTLDVHVNPIGTDYRLFATRDLSDQAILNYYGKLLGVSMKCEGDSDAHFDLRLEQLTEAAMHSYLNALVESLIKELNAPGDLASFLKSRLTLEPLQTEAFQQTKHDLDAEFQARGIEQRFLLDQLLKEASQGLNLLQKAQADLLSDYRTLKPLWDFKRRTPGTQLFTSIGRLDPEKNVLILLDAYLTYLQRCIAEHQPIRHSLLLFIVPSRLEVPAYQQELNTILEKFLAIKRFLSEHSYIADNFVYLAEEKTLQEALTSPGKTPSKPKLISPNAMVEFYRLGPVMISSRADGMNLVVKEWVSAQDSLVQSCLQRLFHFVQDYSSPVMSRTMGQEEKDAFIIYARALQESFTENKQLYDVLTKLELDFTSILTAFFQNYKEEIPALPMLSQNAGASAQLQQACIIDPLNPTSLLEQFQQMDCLNPIQRVARAIELKRTVQCENGQEWRRDIIDQVLVRQTMSDSSQHIAQTLVKKNGLIFIDYDGTISPHVPNPYEAWPDPRARTAILDLMKVAPEQVVFITGRDIATFESIFWGGPGREELVSIPLTVIGSHGLEVKYRDGFQNVLVDFTEREQVLIRSLKSETAILELKQAIRAILVPYFDSDIDPSLIDALIEEKNYSISIVSSPLRDLIKNESDLNLVEHKFAQLLKAKFLTPKEGESPEALANFSVQRGIHICELRYNQTKAKAASELLKDERYRSVTHIAFMGDDFGQAHQPGTDYSFAAWINEHNANPQSPYTGTVIQVMPDHKRPTQKQSLSSPARPNLIVRSPNVAGEFLTRCSKYAFEANSRHALITQAIAQLSQRFAERTVLLPSKTKALTMEQPELFDAGPDSCQGFVKI
ncbi:trehalose-6-phosphate synthase [Legionella yabuuchiae]|uniref:trehalose-6-phosphate synthase n=1 Tax=Legionella yabuuchiae TaxID=376727 RepID=UPI001056667D|nr:trehalose-6-phosphate synthase [Legionella yabuuchiae]